MIIRKKQTLALTSQHKFADLVSFNDSGIKEIAEVTKDDRLIVIISPAGAGKSLLSMALAHELGGKGAIYSSGEMTTDTIKHRLIPAVDGKSLTELKAEPKQGIVTLSKLSKYITPDLSECQTLDSALDVIRQSITNNNEKQIVLLDAFCCFESGLIGSRAEEQEHRLTKLKRFADENNLLVITTEFCARDGSNSVMTRHVPSPLSIIDSVILMDRNGEEVTSDLFMAKELTGCRND